MLLSTRKGDQICHINITFDTIYFDRLIRWSKALSKTGRSMSQVYMVRTLSTLDDILGHRWYIRGINDLLTFVLLLWYKKAGDCKV